MKKVFVKRLVMGLGALLFALAMGGIVACSEEVPEPTPDEPETPAVPEEPAPAPVPDPTPVGRSREIELSAQQRGFVDATINTSFNAFVLANRLERELGEPHPETDYRRDVADNIVFSPLGMSYAAVTLANAAAGESRNQILSALGYSGSRIEDVNSFYKYLNGQLTSLDPTSRYKAANSIWIKSQFKNFVHAAYPKIMEEFYGATTTYLSNFRSDDGGVIIDNWGRTESEGFLESFYTDGDAYSYFLVGNIQYFKSGWVTPFDETETADATFHNEDGTESTVKMMKNKGRFFKKASNKDFLAVRLPYGNEAFSMIVILPRTDIDNCIEAVAQRKDALVDLAKEQGLEGNHLLRLPRFDVSYQVGRFRELMLELGVSDVFDGDRADFSGMFDLSGLRAIYPNPYATGFVQSCRIAVDEKQTEAASGYYVVAHSGEEEDPYEIVFDRPFLFLISERSTGMPVFMGRVTKL